MSAWLVRGSMPSWVVTLQRSDAFAGKPAYEGLLRQLERTRSLLSRVDCLGARGGWFQCNHSRVGFCRQLGERDGAGHARGGAHGCHALTALHRGFVRLIGVVERLSAGSNGRERSLDSRLCRASQARRHVRPAKKTECTLDRQTGEPETDWSAPQVSTTWVRNWHLWVTPRGLWLPDLGSNQGPAD